MARFGIKIKTTKILLDNFDALQSTNMLSWSTKKVISSF